jgi:hypothetical protein
MESPQIVELLLAMRQEINANTKAMQEQADANTKAMQQLKDGMKAYREDLKCGQAKMIAAIKEKTDTLVANIKTVCQYAMETSPEKSEPNSEEKETVMEQQEIPNEEVAVHSQKTCRRETTASQDMTKTEPDPGMMQSAEEHQEIPKEDAAVMPVRGLKKQRRDRTLAAGHRQKPKRRIQATCESRRRLIVAGKKITRHATVAWRKRNVFRRIGTQGICGPRSTLTAAGIMMTRHARVAWRKEKFVRKDCTTDKAEQETPKRLNGGKRPRKGLVCNNGIRDRGLREQLRGRMRISDQCGGQPPYLKKEKTTTNGIGG